MRKLSLKGAVVTVKNRSVVILGGGGHASVVADCLRLLHYNIEGYVSCESQSLVENLRWLGNDDVFCQTYKPDEVRLVNGLGMTRSDRRRSSLFQNYRDLGYRFINLIHPSAIIAGNVRISPDSGVQIMAGSIIQTGASIGPNVLINTGAIIEHHAEIAGGAHIAPGAVICGGARIGKNAFIGARSTVIQGVNIGEDVTVGAGAVVISDVMDRTTVVGVPAKGGQS